MSSLWSLLCQHDLGGTGAAWDMPAASEVMLAPWVVKALSKSRSVILQSAYKKWTLAEPIYHWKKPQELLPIARPPGCGEVPVETSSQRKSLDVITSGTLCPGFCISEFEGCQQTKNKKKKKGGKQHFWWRGWMQSQIWEESIQKVNDSNIVLNHRQQKV